MSALILAASLSLAAHAGPREDFKAAVAAVAKAPGDAALREKAIAMAKKVKPAPAVPEAAERRMARGAAAVADAKTPADFLAAAAEFEAATAAAPWWGDAYYNLGVAYDKAGKSAQALAALKLAVAADPASKDAKSLMYQVEFRAEKRAAAAEAIANRRLRIVCRVDSNEANDSETAYEITGDKAVFQDRQVFKDAFIRKMMSGHGVKVEKVQTIRFEFAVDPADPDHFIETPNSSAARTRSHFKIVDGGARIKAWPEDGVHSESNPYSTCPVVR